MTYRYGSPSWFLTVPLYCIRCRTAAVGKSGHTCKRCQRDDCNPQRDNEDWNDE